MEVVQNRKLLAYKPQRWDFVREIYEFQMIELNNTNQAFLESVQSLDSCYCLIIFREKIIGLSKLVNIDADVKKVIISWDKLLLVSIDVLVGVEGMREYVSEFTILQTNKIATVDLPEDLCNTVFDILDKEDAVESLDTLEEKLSSEPNEPEFVRKQSSDDVESVDRSTRKSEDRSSDRRREDRDKDSSKDRTRDRSRDREREREREKDRDREKRDGGGGRDFQARQRRIPYDVTNMTYEDYCARHYAEAIDSYRRRRYEEELRMYSNGAGHRGAGPQFGGRGMF